MRPIVRRMSFAFLPFALALVASAAPSHAAPAWMRWNEGLQEAKRTHRPVLVDVYTDWCGYCKKLDAEVYSRRDVSDYLGAHFVTVKLNAESGAMLTWQGRETPVRAVVSKFGISGYPTTVFLDSDGNHLVSVPGFMESGRFMLVLRYVGEGHLARQESWDTFVQQQGAAPRGARR